jgi:hypothetical protein
VKFPKINQQGIAHILAPLAFVVIFAGVGGYILTRSHAANLNHWLYGHVKLNGNVVYNAQVKLSQKGVIGASYGYTDKNGYYSFYPIAIGKTYIIHVSKGINGIRYCASRTFVSYYSTSGDEQDFSLSHSAC